MAAYSARYDAALRLAALAHRPQTRKGSDTPYLIHPVHVSVILLRSGFSEDVAVAGLLHDVIEDHQVPAADIEAEFGPAVAEIVVALTEKKQEGGTARPWQIRKQEALEQLRTSRDEAVAVKAADALHNAHSLAGHLLHQGPSAWDAYSRGPAESLWYYNSIVALARGRLGDHPLVAELEGAVRDLERVIAAAESS